MDERLFQILKKTYCKKRYVRDANGCWALIKTGDIFNKETGTWNYSTDHLSAEELFYLNESGYPLNEITHGFHDETILQLKEIIKHPHLSLENLLSAYIAGFGSFPRGRQPILSYLFAGAVPVHSFYSSRGGTVCEICSLHKEFLLNKGEEIFRKYWGYAWNEMISDFYLDLAEFCELDPVIPTKEDWIIFHAVIDFIRNAPKGETIGKLEQRIRKAKIIPHCEKYRLRGQLMALAELGVMPNPYIAPLFDQFTSAVARWEIERKFPGSPRSDVVLPLAGWRGENGICEKRFHELFGNLTFYADCL